MKFKIILETMPGEPRWEFDFHQSSDKMAEEFTQRLMVVSEVVQALRCNVQLFNVDEDGGLVNRYKLAKPTVERIPERA